MANLRLHRERPEDRDVFRFPTEAVSRIGRIDPRCAPGRTEPLELKTTDEVVRGVERVLDRMDRKLAGLRELIGPGFDDDRPRAA